MPAMTDDPHEAAMAYVKEIARLHMILDRVCVALKAGKKHIDHVEQPYLIQEYDDLIRLAQ